MADLEKLRELLKREKYPFEFTFKFVGLTSPRFEASVLKLERDHSKLKLTTKRTTAAKRHTALTYLFHAESPDAILEVYSAIAQIPDVVLVL